MNVFPLVELNNPAEPWHILFYCPNLLIRVKLVYTENFSLLGNLEAVEKSDYVSLRTTEWTLTPFFYFGNLLVGSAMKVCVVVVVGGGKQPIMI